MDGGRKARGTDLVFALTTIGVGVLFFNEARKLPAARFDPLGSASFPLAISGMLVLMGGLALAMALLGRRLGDAETSLIVGVNQPGSTAQPRPLFAACCFLSVAAYALALHLLPGNYFWATAVLISLLGIAMSPRDPRSVAIAVAIGIGGSAALDHVFGTLLRLPMP